MFLHYNASVDPTYNLALEELLTADSTDEHFMLWRNGPSIIVGKHQNTAAEINTEAVRTRDIRVVRRITGGGAVYHDFGNLNFSVVAASREWAAESPYRYTAPVVAALRDLGVPAVFSGRNDILANGYKISGCARSVLKDRTLFHGTLLFNTDLSVLGEVLNPDLEKIRSKGIKSVRARVGNLADMLPERLTMMEFIAQLRDGLKKSLDIAEFSPLPPALEAKAERLAEEKYRTWEWNYGSLLAYDYENSARFEGGMVKASINVEGNRIRELRFSGDFFGSRPVEELTECLTGVEPRRSAVLTALAGVELGEYIYGVTAEELAGLLALSHE